MIAILDGGDIDIDDVAGFELSVAGNTMANLMVDGRANGFGVRVVTGRGVIQRGGYGMLHVDGVIVTELVQLVGVMPTLTKGPI